MGLKIGNFFKNIGNAIKAEIKKVAPKVIAKLENVAKDLFVKGKAVFDKAKTFVQDRIISPLKIGKLMDKLLGGLKAKFEQLSGSVEKGLKDFLAKLQPKTLENGQQVVTPPIDQRSANFSSEIQAILDQVKAAVGGNTTTGTSSSAATATTGSTSSAATSSSSGTREGSIGSAIQNLGGDLAGLSSMQQSMLDKLKASGADAKDIAMQELQMKMGNMTNLMSMISNLMKQDKDTKASIIANYR